MENEKKSGGDKYSKLAGNTLIFAISSFSSKLLTLIVQPFLTYAMAEIADLGLALPESLAAYPDHLSLELDMVSLLLEAGRADDVRQLFLERSAWLTAYRLKLVALGDEALFYLAIVDALLGIRAQLEAAESRELESA